MDRRQGGGGTGARRPSAVHGAPGISDSSASGAHRQRRRRPRVARSHTHRGLQSLKGCRLRACGLRAPRPCPPEPKHATGFCGRRDWRGYASSCSCFAYRPPPHRRLGRPWRAGRRTLLAMDGAVSQERAQHSHAEVCEGDSRRKSFSSRLGLVTENRFQPHCVPCTATFATKEFFFMSSMCC